MYTEDAFIGYSINFQDICLVYPPFNKDVIRIGFDKFSVYLSLLTQTSEDIEDIIGDKQITEYPSPFMYLVVLSTITPGVKDLVLEGLKFFTHEKVTFLPELPGFIIGDLAEKRVINEENFFDFQNIIRSCVGDKPIEKPKENEDPRIKRFKALQRKRDRVKAKQNKSSTKEFLTLLTSVCCMGFGLNPTNVGDITFASTKFLINRYSEKDAYETRIASMLAGAKDNKENSYWIKDL